MIKKIFFSLFYFLILLLTFFAGCKNKSEHEGNNNLQSEQKKKIFTCPMHPQIIRDVPGACPICGMDLVEKKDEGAAIKNDTIAILLKPTDEYVVSKVKTIRPVQKEIPIEIKASGKITYDTREANVVSVRTAGRIEKLYVKYRFQPISKGQKLMDIYSKEFVTEQENFIYLLKNEFDNESLLKAAERRLVLLGFSPAQVKELKRVKKSVQAITIFSPYSGHLHDVVSSESTGSNMSSKKESNSQDLTLKEGMYVEKGQAIFNIYNANKVWGLLTLYPEGGNLVKQGQKVVIVADALDSLKIEGRIDFVEPFITNETNLAQARVYLNNEYNKLKVGTLVKAKIEIGIKKGIFIPATAIVNLGIREVVFVKENSVFKSKIVVSGLKTAQFTEIISGISVEENIAENAQFLMDSESFIKAYNHE